MCAFKKDRRFYLKTKSIRNELNDITRYKKLTRKNHIKKIPLYGF